MFYISEEFEEALKGIREYEIYVKYQSPEYGVKIITQSGSVLETENDLEITTQTGIKYAYDDSLENFSVSYDGALYKSICRYIQFDCDENIPKNTEINAYFKIKVDDGYQTLWFGRFYNIEENKYDMGSKKYTITAYDRVADLMRPLNLKKEDFGNTTTSELLIKKIVDYMNETSAIDVKVNTQLGSLNNLISKDVILDVDAFINKDMTMRDIIDDLCEINCCSFMFFIDGFSIRNVSNQYSRFKFGGDRLISNNVDAIKHYGPVNSMVIQNGSDTILDRFQDSESIEQYGKTELSFNGNVFLSEHYNYDYRYKLFPNMFNEMKGLEYDIVDIDITGILCLYPMEKYEIEYDGNKYVSYAMNNTISITTGLQESISVDEPDENVDSYVAPSNKTLKDAFIDINKSAGQIVLKATSDGRMVKAELNSSPNSGSEFNITADNINLDGYTTINGNFKIDYDGDAYIGNWGVETDSNGGKLYADNTYGGTVYRTFIQDINPTDGLDTWAFSTQKELADGNFQRLCRITMGGDAYFNSVTQTSLEENKKNIQKYDKGLEVINDTDIYSYNLITEDDDRQKHIGFVIGDNYNYSKDIVSINSKNEVLGADTYSMISVCFNAIKEQQKQIEELKKEIESIKELNK